MIKRSHPMRLAMLPLAVSLASAAGQAGAVEFALGDLYGQFDSQLSVGMSMATASADRRFIHVDTLRHGKDMHGQAAGRTSDDNRLNYDRGDIFSKVFRGSHDLALTYNNSGAFFRAKYWYDFEQKDGNQRFYDIDDSGRKPLEKGAGIYLLDAFVYHNYEIGDKPGSIRLGRQVVSWGESTFIGNSINSINPIDVAAFRRPGSEIKEGLIPVEMLYLSQGLSSDLTLEAFYQLKWAPMVLDNCGTFFGADTLATGCNDRLVVAGLDRPEGDPSLQDGLLASFGTPFADYMVRSRKNKDARDNGQWGIALRYYAAHLNDTEFGVYAMNYHSRVPYYSTIKGVGQVVPGVDGANGAAGYFFEYPEDIRLYGVSFQTNLGPTAVSGEFSYRPNMPLGITTGDLSVSALPGVLTNGVDIDPAYRGVTEAGGYIQGYDRQEMYQAQVTAIHFVERVLGASRLTLIGEIGVNYLAGLDNPDGGRAYGRDSLFGGSPMAMADGGGCYSQGTGRADSWCEADGFFTSTSWGYRGVAALDYSNVFRGINLTPRLAWSHDVKGWGPNFSENAKSVSLGLRADYASKYSADLSYTTFFDGKYNTSVDRDFASISLSVSF